MATKYLTPAEAEEAKKYSTASLTPTDRRVIIATHHGHLVYLDEITDEWHCWHGGPPVKGCEPCTRRRG